jgi:hypothetical protein
MISWFIVFSSRADRHRQQIRKSSSRSALPSSSGQGAMPGRQAAGHLDIVLLGRL